MTNIDALFRGLEAGGISFEKEASILDRVVAQVEAHDSDSVEEATPVEKLAEHFAGLLAAEETEVDENPLPAAMQAIADGRSEQE